MFKNVEHLFQKIIVELSDDELKIVYSYLSIVSFCILIILNVILVCVSLLFDQNALKLLLIDLQNLSNTGWNYIDIFLILFLLFPMIIVINFLYKISLITNSNSKKINTQNKSFWKSFTFIAQMLFLASMWSLTAKYIQF